MKRFCFVAMSIIRLSIFENRNYVQCAGYKAGEFRFRRLCCINYSGIIAVI